MDKGKYVGLCCLGIYRVVIVLDWIMRATAFPSVCCKTYMKTVYSLLYFT
jgi:hypothetical protein